MHGTLLNWTLYCSHCKHEWKAKCNVHRNTQYRQNGSRNRQRTTLLHQVTTSYICQILRIPTGLSHCVCVWRCKRGVWVFFIFLTNYCLISSEYVPNIAAVSEILLINHFVQLTPNVFGLLLMLHLLLNRRWQCTTTTCFLICKSHKSIPRK